MRRAIFDWLRKTLGRPIRQREVDELDALLDDLERQNIPVDRTTPSARPEPPRENERDDLPLRASDRALSMIKQFEGFRARAYPDPGTGGAPWTIGYGTTQIDGAPVTPGMEITRERAEELLREDVARFEKQVIAALGDAWASTSQEQFDALVSFAYNVGIDALRRSTLLRKHKAGDYAGAAQEFQRWIYAGGRALKGLARRRLAEARLYNRGSRPIGLEARAA